MNAAPDLPAQDQVCASPRLKKLFSRGERAYLRCDNCGVIVLHPEPSFTELSEYYNSMPANYQAALNQLKSNRIKFRYFFDKYVSKYLAREDYSRRSLIDVGCFCGDFLYVCKNKGISQVMGCEINRTAGQIMRENEIPNIPEVFYNSEKFRDHSADYIFMLDVIEHVNEPKAYLRKAFATLKPGGHLFLTTPNTDSIFLKAFRKRLFIYDGMEHVRLFNASNLSGLLREQGFAVVEKKMLFKRTTLKFFLDIMAAWNKNPGLARLSRWLRKIGEMTVTFYNGELLVVARKP